MSAHASDAEVTLGKRHLDDEFLGKVKSNAIRAGVVSVLAIGLCMFFESMRGRVLFSLLVGATFYLSITLGALWFVVCQHLVKAGWSVAVRRVAEGISLNTTWIWILFVACLAPGLLHMVDAEQHPWPSHFAESHGAEAAATDGAHGAAGHEGEVAAAGGHERTQYDGDYNIHPEASPAKAWWLSGPVFVGRIVVYFLIWIATGFYYFKRSLQQDESGDVALTNKMQFVAPPFMILFAITCCAAGFDLLMALDPAWFSTIFGVYFFSGCVVSAYATIILFLYLFQRQGLVQEVSVEHFHDLGKFMFAFIVFWTYIGFSQFMLQWYGNMPEETIWYLHRTDTSGWLAVTSWLLIAHFFIPFFLLMSRYPKRHPHLLAFGALWVLGVHYMDLFWIVLPNAGALHGKVAMPVLDMAIGLGLGAIFVVATLSILKGKSLIPEKDPRLAESLRFENF